MDGAASDVERLGDLGLAHVVPVGEEHDGTLLHAERRNRSEQIDVGQRIGGRLGLYSEEVPLPASFALPVEVVCFVTDGTDQVAVEVFDVRPIRLLRDTQERRRGDIVGVDRSDDSGGKSHRRRPVDAPGNINRFVGGFRLKVLVLAHQIHLDR